MNAMSTGPPVRACSTLNHSPMFGCDIDLTAQVAAVAAAGFDAVSLDIFSVRAARARGTLDQVASAIVSSGLRVLDVSALLLPADGDDCRAAIAEMAVLASVLDPEWVLVKVSGDSDDQALERLRWAAEGLSGPDGTGPGLAIEPSPVSDMDDPIRALRLIQGAGASRSGVVLDTWHVHVGEWGPEVLDAVAPDGVAFVQLADGHLPAAGSDLMHATLHERVAPGEGTFDLTGWLTALVATGYDGAVCLEVLDAGARAEPVAEFAARLMDASAPCFNALARRRS